jgi:hypothetical protein
MHSPLLASLCVVAAVCGAAADEPYRLHSPEGAFTIELPVPPVYTRKRARDGRFVHQFGVDLADTAFAVSYLDFGPGTTARVGPDALLDTVVRGLGRNSALLAQRSIDVQTLPGREITARLPDGKILRQRHLLHGDRLYTWNYVGPAGTEQAPAVLRYLDSMTLGPRR